MSYQLDPHPTWTAEELRPRLYEILRRALGPDRDRLKALDCATWLPDGVQDAAQLEHRGMPHGPVVQVVAYLASDDLHGKTMRTTIPNRMRWQDVEKMGKQLALTIRNAVKRMRIEEASGKTALVVTSEPLKTQFGTVNPLARAIGNAVDAPETLH